MRDTFVKTLIELAKHDRNIELITADLGFGVLKPFWEQLPDQFTDCGIAEQNMTGIAVGMALSGKTVFTYSIGNFPTLRCLEQIRNDAAYHNANVKIVCIGGGFAYGPLGMSHHATEDIAIMRALPNVVVMTPGDPVETIEATKAIAKHSGTCYLRLGRGGEKRIHERIEGFEIGKAIKLSEGCRIAILSAGAILGVAKTACELLTKDGYSPALYSFHTVKPIDRGLITKLSETFELIVTCEEQNIVGGFGSAVAEVMAETAERRAKLLRIGLNDTYGSIVGTQSYLRDAYGLSAEKIRERVEGSLK